MKRAALTLLLLGNAFALSPEQTAKQYGLDVLKAYMARGTKLAPGRAAVLSCRKVLPKVPDTVDDCRLHIWGAQAVVDIATRDPVKHLGGVSRLWVGQMRGVPSVEQAQQLAQALTEDYKEWEKTQAAKDWFKRQGKPRPGIVNGGFRVPCDQFSRRHLPAGLLTCSEGAGPVDSPTVTLQLADGRVVDAGVR